ncbi:MULTISPECIES: GGDEF domain-containing protein [unclassified Leptolyngbya]|uniref:diguanylate cyclase n=1 Tax=unclassified Leptolyngbya TaxID=2650499 RepID=UPI001683AE87|nr:diguanylate cyclase [Leptolyngbya sp. FACHB-8]
MPLLELALMPHGTCFFWNVPLTTVHVVADGLIGLAYFSIPLILYMNRQHVSTGATPLLMLFVAFIFSCGIGHLLSVWNIWHSDYWLEGIEKLMTAAASVYTAFCLYQKLPDLLQTRKALEETTEMARTDPLTGLANRRGLIEAMTTSMPQLNAPGISHALVLLDLDNFKEINDTCGHLMGDRVLCQVSELLRLNTRLLDTSARIGGDEFAVFLPGCPLPQALEIAERLRMAIALLSKEDLLPPELEFSASVGLVVTNRIQSDEQFYAKADMALYQSKRSGKNRVSWLEDGADLMPLAID